MNELFLDFYFNFISGIDWILNGYFIIKHMKYTLYIIYLKKGFDKEYCYFMTSTLLIWSCNQINFKIYISSIKYFYLNGV